MGQKVNPHGLRVGVIKDWDSKWYADAEFSDYLVEDYNIRKFLKKKLYSAGVSKIEIERASDRVKVIIYTAKPGVVIGKGGAVIRGITEETGATINIEDDGSVTIASVDPEAGLAAQKRIQEITAEIEKGQIYEGTVALLLDFGAIVQLLPGKDGLLHISQIANQRVNAVSDYLKEGQVVRVKVIEADEKGRVRLSMKALLEDEKKEEAPAAPAAEVVQDVQ